MGFCYSRPRLAILLCLKINDKKSGVIKALKNILGDEICPLQVLTQRLVTQISSEPCVQ